jgi:hypothetical protein
MKTHSQPGRSGASRTSASAAADVQQAARPELGRDRQVVVEVAPSFPLDQVVDRRQPRLTEEGIHETIVPRPLGSLEA